MVSKKAFVSKYKWSSLLGQWPFTTAQRVPEQCPPHGREYKQLLPLRFYNVSREINEGGMMDGGLSEALSLRWRTEDVLYFLCYSGSNQVHPNPVHLIAAPHGNVHGVEREPING